MSEGIHVTIASDEEHEKVFAEIYYGDTFVYGDKFVMLVSNEHGTPMVEIPGGGHDESCIARVVPFEWLQEALQVAVRRLNE